MKKGLFITFEGIDASGKSTQAQKLTEYFTSHQQSVLFFREPGGTAISEKIREIILDRTHHMMHARTELLLYVSARAQIVHEKILPALEQGAVVICDRYIDSSVVYQGYGRQLDIEFVNALNRFATSSLQPDCTFLFDISPETSAKRKAQMREQADRLEMEKIDFHSRVREAYLQLAEQEKERFVVIDGEQPIEILTQEMIQRVESLLRNAG